MVGKMVNGTGLTDDRRVSEQVRLESESENYILNSSKGLESESENYILNSSKGLAERDR